mgnify:CR=1 FL=1|jgi:hypothetical protein
MVLSSGTSLGPYQMTAKIGEGGMGEDYQARDTQIDRKDCFVRRNYGESA